MVIPARESFAAKGAVKPAVENLRVQYYRHAVVVGLQPSVSPTHNDRARLVWARPCR
jgi:hypothetical protein